MLEFQVMKSWHLDERDCNLLIPVKLPKRTWPPVAEPRASVL